MLFNEKLRFKLGYEFFRLNNKFNKVHSLLKNNSSTILKKTILKSFSPFYFYNLSKAMSNFDVFINGIQPDQATKSQQIIEEFSKKLQISSQEAKKIISSPNTRISHSASKEQAKKLQQSLQEIGVICIFRPSSMGTELSLEPLEIKEEIAITTCPNCNSKFSGDSNTPPEKCDNCGVYIEKFLQINSDQNEKEEIKRRILLKNSMQADRGKKIKDEKEAEIRKKILEQAVLDENPDIEGEKKKNKQPVIIFGGAALVASAACISYILFAQNENLPVEAIHSSSIVATTQEKIQETGGLETELPASPNLTQNEDELATEIPTSSSSPENIDELATEIPVSSTSVAGLQVNQNNASISSSQEGLSNTHEQASQVLNAFGLDPDAFANNSSNSQGKTSSSSLASTGLSNSHLNNLKILEEQPHKKTPSGVSNNALTTFLLNYGIDEQEWEYYLTKKIEKLIKNNNFAHANQLISYLKNTENFIFLSSKLLNNIGQTKINSSIETKIISFPLELQAQYFSQAAQSHNKKETSDILFIKAEKHWELISGPNKQLSSALQIAVSYFKFGNTASANRFFKKIKPLLSQISTAENQIISRTAISHAFQEVGQNKIALNWLKSTDKFIKNANKSSLQEIINSYAYLNQLSRVSALVKQVPSTGVQDELLYNAVKVSLDSGLNNNAINLAESIKNPMNKALAYTLLASYLEDKINYLSSAETLLNKINIKEASNIAIISSRIAQQYARQKNTSKVNDLFQQTKQLIGSLPSSAEKDNVLEIVMTNYAYSLEHRSAMMLSSYFQSSTNKLKINKKIEQLSKIPTLIRE